MDDGRKIYSVSELNREIKSILEDSYPDIWLMGEVSNFKVYPSGHMYFSLKDEDSQISAVIFQGAGRFLKCTLEDGLKVIVRGRVSSYPKRGDYQILINYVEPAGRGALQLAFEQLKAKLEKEGLFRADRKRSIPLLPQKIAIVTSQSGAALHDMLTVMNRRFANIEVLIYPVRVQGDGAKDDIAEAICFLNDNYPGLDVMLVGRGGGSIEDLWAFNEEKVARAIAASRVPIISCVGHETDFTIADFVADLRAPTPSAAAELVVRNKTELLEKIGNLRHHLVNNLQLVAGRFEQKLRYLAQSRAMRSPQEFIDQKMLEIDGLFERLSTSLKRILENKENDCRQVFEKLELLSPLAILGRGYSICWKLPSGGIVRGASQVAVNDRLRIKLFKGELTGKVEKVTRQ